MVTCCDYIYILCGDTYIMNVTNGNCFGEARAPQGQGLSALSVFFFVRFLFFSRSFVDKDQNDTHRKPPY